ncbi:hypothetical protein [Mucilaginibacter ginkgonis]|uniref:Uncharacterized protein n=1 Tax=Mucilaginibacter ginkgonis TaxID=2682091 RepID=A0A6I4INU3_9SPHI|nr:hypothetical protein [Mucilaginibacter ginkgonis]QQL48847.1 hypothetical protein GO620_011725 [Mucilaginibacter ginkgonis]
MTVEILQSDTPEEVDNKLSQIDKQIDKKNEERFKRVMKYFGSVKLDIDPLKLQRQWRDEWE